MVHVRRILVEYRDAWIGLGLTLLVMVTGSTRLARGVCGVYHDDAIYVSTAKSLADGDGYRLTGVPGSPRQTKYPILYPAILAVVWRAFPTFPDNLWWMQCLSLATGSATVALAYLFLVRSGYFSRPIAVLAGFSCAVSSGYLFFCTLTMAEATFALAFVTALWAVEGQAGHPVPNRRAETVVGILTAVPFLLRTIGAPLVPVALWLLYRRGHRLRWYLAGMSVVVLPWIVWSLTAWGSWDRNPVDGYYTDYLGSWTATGTHLLGRVVAVNAMAIVLGTGELCLGGLMCLMSERLPGLLSLIAVLLPGLIACIAVVWRVRERRVLPWAIGSYLGVVLLWSWPPDRFLMPLLPYLAAYLYGGSAAILRHFLPDHAIRRVGAVFLVCLLGANLQVVMQQGRLLHDTGYPRLKVTDHSLRWSSYEDVFAWLVRHTEADAVLASGLDSMLSLYTGRQAYRPFVYCPDKLFYGDSSEPLITVPQLADILQSHKTDYLVQLPMPDYSEEQGYHATLAQLRTEFPQWLRPVYQGADVRFVIYQLDPQHAPAASPSDTVESGTALRAVRMPNADHTADVNERRSEGRSQRSGL